MCKVPLCLFLPTDVIQYNVFYDLSDLFFFYSLSCPLLSFYTLMQAWTKYL
jgi:hypothetical protein